MYDLEHPTDHVTKRKRFSLLLRGNDLLLTITVNSQVRATVSVAAHSCVNTLSLWTVKTHCMPWDKMNCAINGLLSAMKSLTSTG